MCVFMATATVFFVFADSARVCHKVSPLPSRSVNHPRTKKFLVARSTAGWTTKSKFNIFLFASFHKNSKNYCSLSTLNASCRLRRARENKNCIQYQNIKSITKLNFSISLSPGFNYFFVLLSQNFLWAPQSAPEGQSIRFQSDSRLFW